MSTLTIYSKDNCSQCSFTKRFLSDHQVPYQEVNVLEDQEALDHIQSLGFQSLPVVEAPGLQPFCGFNMGKLQALLKAF